jgi:hypothetical protein
MTGRHGLQRVFNALEGIVIIRLSLMVYNGGTT